MSSVSVLFLPGVRPGGITLLSRGLQIIRKLSKSSDLDVNSRGEGSDLGALALAQGWRYNSRVKPRDHSHAGARTRSVAPSEEKDC